VRRAVAASRSALSRSALSTEMPTTFSPSSAAARVIDSSFRLEITNRAPSAARAFAEAKPRPALAPVTM
jgi:hypothetical protein